MLVKGFDAALEGVGIEKANFEQLATKLQILLDVLQRGGTNQPDSPRSSTAGKLEASDATLVQASARPLSPSTDSPVDVNETKPPYRPHRALQDLLLVREGEITALERHVREQVSPDRFRP